MIRKEITVFPGLFPEESLIGYLQRAVTLNRAVASLGYSQLRGTRAGPPTSAMAFPSNLDYIAKQAKGVFGSADYLARHHTLEPLFRWTLSAPAFVTLQNWHRTGIGNLAIRLRGNALGQEYSRHCPACAEEDVRRFGVPYWRRAAQLAFMAVCPVHEEILLGGCGRCLQAQLFVSSWPLPSHNCVCGQAQIPVVSGQLLRHKPLLLRIARITQELLAQEAPAQIGTISPIVCRTAAIEQGFVANRGVSPRAMNRSITERGGIEAISAFNIPIGRSGYMGMCGIQQNKSFQSITYHLLVLDLLFESVNEYVEKCTALKPDQYVDTNRQAAASPEKILRWRTRLENLLESHPNVSRSQLNRMAMSLMANLRKFDGTWLDERWPKRYSSELGGRRAVLEARAHRNDLHVAEHIRKRAADLLKDPGRPRQLNKSTLLSGNRTASSLRTLKLGPASRQALDVHIESTEQFGRRCVNWALENPNAFKSLSTQVDYVARYGRSSLACASALIESYRVKQIRVMATAQDPS